MSEDEQTIPGRKRLGKPRDPAEAPTKVQDRGSMPPPPVVTGTDDTHVSPKDRTHEVKKNQLLKVHNAWNIVMSSYDFKYRENPEVKKVLEDMQEEIAQNLEELVSRGLLPLDWAGGAGD